MSSSVPLSLPSIGILGGGQLARMMVEDGKRMGFLTMGVLDPTPDCPAAQVGAEQSVGSFRSPKDVVEFGLRFDLVTCDLEDVSVEGMEVLEREGIKVHPSPAILKVIQDKQFQKNHFERAGLPVIPSLDLNPPLIWPLQKGPFVFKRRRGGYDGKGVSLGVPFSDSKNVMVEPYLEIEKELAVMVAASADGPRAYPVVETIQEDGICKRVEAPAKISPHLAEAATRLALDVLASFNRLDLPSPPRGIFGVEMFLLKDGRLILNEVAPRPHNSGHYTLDACVTSQFEQHLRSISGLPLGDPSLRVASATMTNLLGTPLDPSHLGENTKLHWYGKGEVREGRKMGHLCEVREKTPKVAVIMGSSSDLPVMNGALEVFREHGLDYFCQIVSAHRDPEGMVWFAKEASVNGFQVIIAGAGGAAHLPGMVASLTHLPVIGVPIPTTHLGGQDSLYSIVQMPDGVPVATVGIGKAKNAAILAMRILGLWSDEMAKASHAILKANLAKVKSQRASLPQ